MTQFFKYNETMTREKFEKYSKIDELIRRELRERKVSVAELAEETGCQKITLYNLINGQTSKPSFNVFSSVFESLGLITLSDEPFAAKIKREPLELLRETGISSAHIRYFRSGRCLPTWGMLLKICVVLDEDPLRYLEY
ncbi:MAG: helix-turn-helix domain-containing protein [Bacilli bacterium]